MKRGTKVAVCHDGKWSRMVEGVVVDTRRGHHIKVSFFEPCIQETVQFWARKVRPIRYAKKSGCMLYLKRYSYYAGWANIDLFFPWFSVSKL